MESFKKKGGEIWAIGGGKGGTGKSFIASNIGNYLAARGDRVVLIDADFGGANLHTFLGINKPKYSLTDFFERKLSLAEIIIDGTDPKMGFVSGDVQSFSTDSIKYTQKLKFFSHIKALDTDYILLDLGSGTHFNTLDTFLVGDKLIMVIVPEITAIDNMYQFIKKALFRKLKNILNAHGLKDFAENTWKNRSTTGIRSMKEFVDFLKRSSTEIMHVLNEELSDIKIYLVLNQVKKNEEIIIGNSVKSVCLKYFGLHVHYAGHIGHDDSVYNCINERKSFISAYPSSPCTQGLRTVAENLLGTNL
ncbi:MAG: P-loop NTPase [Thermodesulfovibrionales bacterium]|jgi:flagellar biosynthesis protein FlhG